MAIPSLLHAAVRPIFQLRPVARAVLGLVLGGAAFPGYGLPVGAEISAGGGVVSQAGNALTVQQTSPRLAINWQSFGIGATESVVFRQPDASAIALNRVLGQDPSIILGRLSANGQVFVLNPNGVLFGQGAQVDVGGIVASTLGLSDADFLAGRYTFGNGGGAGTVVNRGTIRAADGGYVALIAPQVVNEGVVAAHRGTVALAAGDQVTLRLEGQGLVGLTVDKATVDGLVANRQLIRADGGTVILSAQAKDAVLDSVVNNEGVVEARSVSSKNGVIRLEGGVTGVVSNSGRLDASGAGTGETGGQVAMTGDLVGLMDGAIVDASGRSRGGTVRLGGDYQGRNSGVQNASRTYVGPDASIRVDATEQGDGGRAIVWADDATRFRGTISARGGANGGDGGFVEVSGKRSLDFDGRVDTSAARGVTGTLLLDPSDITISTAANSGISGGPNFTGTAAASNLRVATLQTALASNNVLVDTSSAFGSAGNITVSNTVTWASPTSLTLRAHNNINVNATVSATGAGGSIALIADQDISGAGNVLLSASLSAAGGTIGVTGVNVISLAAGSITSTGAGNGAGGAVLISAAGNVGLAGAITANGGTSSGTNPGRAAGSVTIAGNGVTTAAITASGSGGAGTSQAGGNGGAVQIMSTNGVSTGAVTTNGGNGSASAAAGGAAGTIVIANSGAGSVNTGALAARNGRSTGTVASGLPGSVTVTNSAGAITAAGLDTSGQSNGSGGDVELSSVGLLGITGAIATGGGTAVAGSAGSDGGDVTLSGAGVSTTSIAAGGSAGATAGSSQPGGAGGAVRITSTNGVTTTTIGASGGAATTANAAGGNAGSITIANSGAGNVTTGALTAGAGAATGAGVAGTAGSIEIANSAPALIATGALSTAGGAKGDGGAIRLISAGDVLVGGTIGASAGAGAGTMGGASGGSLTIRGVNRTVTGAITASGGSGAGASAQSGGSAGTVVITGVDGTAATAGTLSTAAITASTGAAVLTGAGGAAGSITLEGTTLSATTLTTTGGANGAGGAIAATATGGPLNVTGAITASGGTANAGSAGSDAGEVTLSGAGVSTTTITASGSGAAAAGSSQPGGAGGVVRITSTDGVSTTAIGASGGAATTGNAAGGNAGSITIANSTTGNVTTGALTVRAGASTGSATSAAGSIDVANTAAGAFVQTGAIDTRGNSNSAGGDVTLASTGPLQFGAAATIQTSAGTSLAGVAGQRGGAVSLGGASVVTTGAITTSGGAGSGADLAGGDAGSITVVADSGAIDLSASVLTAAGGAASAAGNADGGSGGAVRLDAGTGSTIGIPNVTTSGGNRVGTGSAGAGGNMTFADAVLLQANTVLAADGGSAGLGAGGHVQFASTVDSAGANRTLAVNTGGTTTFGGAVGGIAPLASLTTNAAGSTLINGGGVTTTGDQIYNDPVTIIGPTTLAASAGAITATSAVTAGGALTLVADAGRDISLANAANDFGTVAIAGARNATLVDANDLTLGTSTLSGRLTARTGGTIQLAGNLTAGGTGDAIVLAAGGSFDNAGGFALDAGAGRWLVYSIDPSANAFGGLASGNQALWNRVYPAVVPEAGNRYVFSTQPTLTFTSTDVAKPYGQDAAAAVAGAYAVTGFVDASAYGGVFSQDTATNTFSSAPAVTSPGAPGTASVAGSPYPIDVDVTGVTPTTGYGKAAVSTGVLSVNAAPLTITADNQWKVYGAADPVLAATFTGLQNGETPSVVTGLSLIAPTGAAATVTGSPHPITAFGASAANYTISYVDGLLTVAPRPISITADAQTKVYSQPDPALTYAVGGSGLAYGDVLAGELSRVAGGNVGTGPYPILQGTLTNAGNPNYDIAYNGNVLSITPATLTYLADPVSIARGSRFPTFTGSVEGFKGSDTQSNATTGSLAFNTVASNSITPGAYPIYGSGLSANFGNYVFVQAPTNATALTISPGGVPNPPGVPPDAYTGGLASAAQSESTCAELQAGGQTETLCGAQQNFRASEQVNLVPGWRRVIELGSVSLSVEGQGARPPEGARIR